MNEDIALRGSMTARIAYLIPLVAAFLAACEEDDDSGYLADAGADGGASDEARPDFDRFDDNDDESPGSDQDPAFPDLPEAVPPEAPELTTCGEATCRDVLVGDMVVPPCCPEGSSDRCGLDLSLVSGFMPVVDECVEIDQPGNLDSACPGVLFDDPTERRDLPGCCTPEGTCGVWADLSLLADFGCVEPSELLLVSVETETCTPESPEPDDDTGSTADDDAGPVVRADAGPASEPDPVEAGVADVDADAGLSDAGAPAPPASDSGISDGGN